MSRMPTIRRSFGRLSSSATRTGRRSLVLGALLLAASTVTVLATANTRPTITAASLSRPVVHEGEKVTLSVSFTDPDVADYHALRIKWDDTNTTEQVSIPFGQTSFQVEHTYVDDNEGPNQGRYVRFVLYDRQTPPGSEPNDNVGDAAPKPNLNLPFQVNNVAPRFVDRSITVTKKGLGLVVVEGDVVDPGSADQIEVTATWGDPTAPGASACSIGKGGRHFVCEHTYRANLQPKTYPIVLTVKDDDGGSTQYRTSVRLP